MGLRQAIQGTGFAVDLRNPGVQLDPLQPGLMSAVRDRRAASDAGAGVAASAA